MTSEEEIRILHQLREHPELPAEIAADPHSELAVQQRLRPKYGADLVRAAIGLVEARRKAASLLPSAEELWLTRVGLEQSTAWEVAQHKAKRFPAGSEIRDLCSGIGVDSAALVQQGSLVSFDVDSAMILRCQWNLEVWRNSGVIRGGYGAEHQAADIRSLDVARGLLHIDPDRRGGRERPVKRLEQYCPDLTWMQTVVKSAHGGALKIGPAANFMQKFPGCEIELISLHGECREATVWFGSLAGKEPFRATLLPSGETICGDPLESFCPTADAVGRYVFDPDPAIVRSGLLDLAGELHSLQRLDQSDEYLTGNHVPHTVAFTAFEVEAVLSNNPRELTSYLQTTPSRHYEIKCRHLKADANVLQRRLPRGDHAPRVLLFARQLGRATVIVARRLGIADSIFGAPVDDTPATK